MNPTNLNRFALNPKCQWVMKKHYSFAIDLKSIQVNEMKKEYSDFFYRFIQDFSFDSKFTARKEKVEMKKRRN